jgi:hypothetical protein
MTSIFGSLTQAAGFALVLIATYELGGPWPFVFLGGLALMLAGVAIEKQKR